MAGRRRTQIDVEARRRNLEQLARLGADVRSGRRRRGLTQASLGLRAGVSRMTVSRVERGAGGGVTVDAWQRVAGAIGRPLIASLQRDLDGETADAGHLAVQELVLRLGRSAGFQGRFELATRPAEPWRSADIGLIDDVRRRMILVECWNTIGDVGAACRGSTRKQAEMRALAAARWGSAAGPVSLVWVVRSSARNRAIVARYPEVFAARFAGSSVAWSAVLSDGRPAPTAPGLLWSDAAATRVFPWRRRPTPLR